MPGLLKAGRTSTSRDAPSALSSPIRVRVRMATTATLCRRLFFPWAWGLMSDLGQLVSFRALAQKSTPLTPERARPFETTAPSNVFFRKS